MATVKVSSSKTGAKAVNYAKNKAVVMNGLFVDPEYAIGQMDSVRKVHEKTDGVQAHLFIQSFSPGEVDPQKANDIGMELAEAISDGKHYQVAIYTHADTNHVHNHIILNSVDFETGMKYQQSFDVDRVRALNDSICKAHDLSIVQAKERDKTPIEELKAKESGQLIWKDELRSKISQALSDPTSVNHEKLKENLAEKGVNIRFRGKGVSYSFTDSNGKNRISRGSKLGGSYERKTIDKKVVENQKLTQKLSVNPEKEIKTAEERIKKIDKKLENNNKQINKFEYWQNEVKYCNKTIKSKENKSFKFFDFKAKWRNKNDILQLMEKRDKVRSLIQKSEQGYNSLVADTKRLSEEKKSLEEKIDGLKPKEKAPVVIIRTKENSPFSLSEVKKKSKELEKNPKRVKPAFPKRGWEMER